jgi:RNase adaptor protein for sRNA GlmZ degradation
MGEYHNPPLDAPYDNWHDVCLEHQLRNRELTQELHTTQEHLIATQNDYIERLQAYCELQAQHRELVKRYTTLQREHAELKQEYAELADEQDDDDAEDTSCEAVPFGMHELMGDMHDYDYGREREW